ncbi:hypothetical protein PV04_10736 [Phialophora macrospora]|uniref:Uncharacterized protein n=1 Tax=Phialophora macrospora TaxID=1851006 RepID=A0A0D2FRF9_9EURO|nr:hypothetical protein PV04_10736 [Phialophora macrospora]
MGLRQRRISRWLSVAFYLMDVHKFSRSRLSVCTKLRQPTSSDKVSLRRGADGAGSRRKRKSLSNSGTVEWQLPQSLGLMSIAVAVARTDRPLKQHRPSSNPPTINPAVILIDDNSTTNDDAAQSEAATVYSPQGSLADDGDGIFTDLKYSPSLSRRPTLHETTRSLELADSDDGVDLDAIFEQYLRSPSSSPPTSSFS